MGRVDRSKLVIGTEYYFSDRRIGKGVFTGRDRNSIYFVPTVLDVYRTVKDGKWKGTVDFFGGDSLQGFVEVVDSTVKVTSKDLDYWRVNAEEDYLKVPISVLRYITELEDRVIRSYSEEEVIDFLQEISDWPVTFEGRINITNWFNKLKRK